MRIAVTGASGNIGTALLRRLVPGHEVVGIVRRPPPAEPPYDAVTWHAVDLADPDADFALAPAFAGIDAVVHLAWGFQPSRDLHYLERLGVGGTRAVLEAARAAGVGQLVHMSSVGAYAAAPGRRVAESWPTDGVPSSAYSRHKAAAERLLDAHDADDAHDAPALRVARIRPGFVLQRAAGSALLRYGLPGYVPTGVLRLVPVLPLDRRLLIPVVHSDDVADAVVRVLGRRATGAFNIAAEPAITRDDVAAALGARAVHVPAAATRVVLDATWRARLQALSPGWLDLAFAVPLLDTDRARTELGWEPTLDARDVLREGVAGMADAAGTASPVLRPRRAADLLSRLVKNGPIGARRLS